MTAAAHSAAYPLEALHRREAWRLEALQTELAAVARRLADSAARHEALRTRHRIVAAAAAPHDRAVIDPASAQSRLLYLSELQGRMKATAHALVEIERSHERLRAAGRAQQARFESIERHRHRYTQDRAAETARLDGIEADRDWMARADGVARAGEPLAGEPDVDGDPR